MIYGFDSSTEDLSAPVWAKVNDFQYHILSWLRSSLTDEKNVVKYEVGVCVLK